MVFESLVKAKNAEKRPWLVFLLGILYSSIAVIFGLLLFKRDIGILVVSIIVFASIPLMYKIVRLEEKKDKRILKERKLLMEHRKALVSFVALFFGVLISLSLWYVFLPSENAKEVFSSQIKEVNIVEREFSGNAVKPGDFFRIFFNNFKVLGFSFVFSFFFGAGAIFILTWNASLIAVAVGSFVRESLSSVSGSFGFVKMAAYFGAFSYGLLGYLTHGIFEIVAFFIAGLAGGIISVAVIRHDFFDKKFKRIFLDSLWLLGISVVVLLIGALVESVLSPLLF
ncbi:MAG: stage II sporulation protein M [Candidatus Woesearchaeota archaeon]